MLDIDFTTVIFQIVNFLVLAALLYFLLFKKIIKRAEKRKEELTKIKQAAIANLQESEKMRLDLENSQKNFDENLDQYISQVKSELETIRFQVINEIKAESEQIYHQAREDAKSAQKLSLEEFHARIMEIILGISQNLLSESITPEVHENLIKQINDSVWEKGKKEMRQVETIRKSLKDREPTLSITTALPIGSEQQGKIIRTFSALADKNIKLEINQDENLIAGACLRLGDYIFDNSLKAKMEEVRDSVEEELKSKLDNLLTK